MKFAFTQIILAALAVTPSLGSTLQGQNDLGQALQHLTRESNGQGHIKLSNDASRLQSVDNKGKVLGEIQLTPEQASDLHNKHTAKMGKIKANNGTASSSASTQATGLEKRELTCDDHLWVCDTAEDCWEHNCEDCFNIRGMGACIAYS
ncbi:hypothetical protein PENSTE_c017G03111 [Penicillium steckii]|uniref:Uncharacterized protein n=1 Tax=Penicillium steckii TaxID=303698 RepID=A0A1V6SYP2_9EURO|nr:hypothetical protein PENSTE_c017G03111 [Penicillium steckii]